MNCPFCGSDPVPGVGSWVCGSLTGCFGDFHRTAFCRDLSTVSKPLRDKVEVLTKELDALAMQLERAEEEIEVHKERINDLRELVQEYRQCIRPGDLSQLREPDEL